MKRSGADGVPNDLAVNSAGDAVLELQVHLGDGVIGEDRGVGDITCTGSWSASTVSTFIPPYHHNHVVVCQFHANRQFLSTSHFIRGIERTDSSGLNHVADGEALDRLVLGNATSAVGAADRLDVAAAVLVATAVKSQFSLFHIFADSLPPRSQTSQVAAQFTTICPWRHGGNAENK